MTQVTGRQAAKNAAKWGLITWLAITAVGAFVGYAVDQTSGLWGSALGALVAGLFFAVTAIVAVKTTTLGPEILGAVILGSWLFKIVLLMAALAWLRGQDFYSRPFFFVVLLAQTMVLLVLEATLLTKAKVPYVEPDR
ncbi:MAG: hypothetical protein RIR66_741 [Actinomycetota bacterium]|jgi:hypothetical protein